MGLGKLEGGLGTLGMDMGLGLGGLGMVWAWVWAWFGSWIPPSFGD